MCMYVCVSVFVCKMCGIDCSCTIHTHHEMINKMHQYTLLVIFIILQEESNSNKRWTHEIRNKLKLKKTCFENNFQILDQINFCPKQEL